MLGYIVDYQTKDRVFFTETPGDNFSERKRTLVRSEVLAGMLRQQVRYLIHSAILVDMDQYRLSHAGEEPETLVKIF